MRPWPVLLLSIFAISARWLSVRSKAIQAIVDIGREEDLTLRIDSQARRQAGGRHAGAGFQADGQVVGGDFGRAALRVDDQQSLCAGLGDQQPAVRQFGQPLRQLQTVGQGIERTALGSARRSFGSGRPCRRGPESSAPAPAGRSLRRCAAPVPARTGAATCRCPFR